MPSPPTTDTHEIHSADDVPGFSLPAPPPKPSDEDPAPDE